MNQTASRIIISTLLVAFSITTTLYAAPKEDIPVAPIKSDVFQGWSNAYVIANSDLTVATVPAIGRIIFIGPDKTKNLLTFNEGLVNKLPSPEGKDWSNYGGDWLFPVAQTRWATFQDGDWPPSRLLDGRPWTGRAWKNADGTQCCLMQQEYDQPLNIKVTRLIKVPPSGSAFTIEQRIERLQESSIPVTLWNISQIQSPQAVVFPTMESDTRTNGYIVMMGEEPGPDFLHRCEDVAVFDTTYESQVKFGSGSTQLWVAACAEDCILTERAKTDMEGNCYPDGGCSIEIYANKGLGYAEIENLSVEKSLNPGETMQNTLHIRLSKPEKAQKATCEAAKTVKNVLFPPEEPNRLEKSGILPQK